MPNEYSPSATETGQSEASTSNRPAGATAQSPREQSDSQGSTRDAARAAGKRIKNEAREVRQELRSQTEEMVHELRQQGEAVVQERKQRAADEISHIGKAAHKAAEQLRQDQDEALATYVDVAGEQVDRVADYVRNRSLPEIAEDARSFAREHPQVFFGALIVAGIAAARFIKASNESAQRSRTMAGDADIYDTDLEEGLYGEPVPGSYTPAGDPTGGDELSNPGRGSAPLGPSGMPMPEANPSRKPDPTIPSATDSSRPQDQARKARGFGHTPGFKPEDDGDGRIDPGSRF